MTTPVTESWDTSNQRYLVAAVQVLRLKLELHQAAATADSEHQAQIKALLTAAQKEVEEAQTALTAPAALDVLTALLGLSDFERNLLLMCAAIELDADFSTLVASLQNGAFFCPYFSGPI